MISTTGRIPHRGADTGSHDRISEIGVLRRAGAELLEHPLGDAHRAAHLGDVLAHDEDVVVRAHRARARRERFAVGDLRHRRT
jgi:hypothetical protein